MFDLFVYFFSVSLFCVFSLFSSFVQRMCTSRRHFCLPFLCSVLRSLHVFSLSFILLSRTHALFCLATLPYVCVYIPFQYRCTFRCFAHASSYRARAHVLVLAGWYSFMLSQINTKTMEYVEEEEVVSVCVCKYGWCACAASYAWPS